MSELVVIAYPEEGRAEEVMAALLQLRKQSALDLEDVVVVSKDKNERIKLRQSEHLGRKGAVAGGAIGLIAGMLFLGPVVGLGVGALVGGITNRLRDVGVSDDFVRQVERAVEAGKLGSGAAHALKRLRRVVPRARSRGRRGLAHDARDGCGSAVAGRAGWATGRFLGRSVYRER